MLTAAAMTDAPALALRGIVKRFGSVTALDEVSLDAIAGEVVALLGENGAGKSTLLRVMSGELRPDHGSVAMAGAEVTVDDPGWAREHGIAVVHQEPEILGTLSVAENLLLPYLGGRGLRSAAVRRRDIIDRARQMVAEVGFGEQLDPRQPAAELTPGTRQVLEIVRALAGRPRVLALDEPTASLSEREADRLFALVDRLRHGGVAVVYVTHRLAEVERLCDRIVVLRDGKLVTAQPRTELDETEIVRLMVGRERLAVRRRERPMESTAVRAGAAPRLAVRDLTTERVHRVNLSVATGEVLGVGGLVGSGRSAIARAIAAVDPLVSGNIAVDGVPLRLRNVRDTIAQGVSLIPEDRKHQGLVNDRSIRENISLTASRLCTRHGWVNRRTERRLARHWMDELDVRASSHAQTVSTLSGGNQQKIVIARALAAAPKVLILDEPTKGVDVGARAEIYRIIDDLTHDGMSVLFISSELPELLAVSDRIVMIADGEVAGEVHRAEATEELLLGMVLEHARTPAREGQQA